MREAGHNVKLAASAISSAVSAQTQISKMEEDMKQGGMSEDAFQLNQQRMMQLSLKAIWKMGILQTEQFVREVCEKVILGNAKENPETVTRRARALRFLGQAFESAAERLKQLGKAPSYDMFLNGTEQQKEKREDSKQNDEEEEGKESKQKGHSQERESETSSDETEVNTQTKEKKGSLGELQENSNEQSSSQATSHISDID